MADTKLGTPGTVATDPFQEFLRILQGGIGANPAGGNQIGPVQTSGPIAGDVDESKMMGDIHSPMDAYSQVRASILGGNAGPPPPAVSQPGIDESRLFNGTWDPNAPPIFKVGDFTYNKAQPTTINGGSGVGGASGIGQMWNSQTANQAGVSEGWKSTGELNGRGTNWEVNYGQPGNTNPNNFNLAIKNSESTGLDYTYTKSADGQYWVPSAQGTGINMLTNDGHNNWVLPVLMLAAAYGSAAYGAAAGAGTGSTAAGADANLVAATGGGFSSGSTGAEAALGIGDVAPAAGAGAPVGAVSAGDTDALAGGINSGQGAGVPGGEGLTGSNPYTPAPGAAGSTQVPPGTSNPNSNSTPKQTGSQTTTQDPSGLWKDAGALYNLFQALTGDRLGGSGNNANGVQTKSGTSSTTTQTNVTPDAYYSIIKDIIENPQTGLASVMAGQSAAGGYGGSTPAFQMNDLIARATSEIAKLSAPTTQTHNENWVGTGGALGGSSSNSGAPGLSTSNITNDIPGLIRLIGRFFEGSGSSSGTPVQSTGPIA